MSSASFYKWLTKYGGMEAPMRRRLKELEDKNRRLRRMYADLSIQTENMKNSVKKSASAPKILAVKATSKHEKHSSS